MGWKNTTYAHEERVKDAMQAFKNANIKINTTKNENKKKLLNAANYLAQIHNNKLLNAEKSLAQITNNLLINEKNFLENNKLIGNSLSNENIKALNAFKLKKQKIEENMKKKRSRNNQTIQRRLDQVLKHYKSKKLSNTGKTLLRSQIRYNMNKLGNANNKEALTHTIGIINQYRPPTRFSTKSRRLRKFLYVKN